MGVFSRSREIAEAMYANETQVSKAMDAVDLHRKLTQK